jgi:hypothetical protein
MITLHPDILTKDGKPQFAVLPYEEFLQVQAALARLGASEREGPRFGGFYENLSAAEHAARQGVKPIANLDELAWPGDPADWEGFEEAVNEWRYAKQNP